MKSRASREGFLALLRRLAAGARAALQREPPGPWVSHRQAVDRSFDSRFAVDTGGVTYLSGLRIEGEHRRFGVSHIASDPEELDRALASLPADLDRFTFVDLGAGKGRAVLIASRRPFRRIIGVEFAHRLHRIAARNVARFPKEERGCDRIDLVCEDAATYELPHEDTVLFMYNPFGPEVMRKVADRTRASLGAAPRRLCVLYTNPFHADIWIEAGFREVAREHNFALFVPSGPRPD